MISTIWAGASNASDIFFLIAAIVAGLLTVIELLRVPEAALLPAAVTLIALGLLAI